VSDSEGQEKGDHGKRMADNAAVSGSQAEVSVAAVAASWLPEPKSESDFTVNSPKLKSDPAISTKEDRISLTKKAISVAVKHMHAAEQGKVPSVVGMKTYTLSIMIEVFKLTPKQVARDEGALSDLNEYLIDMVRETQGVDTRSSKFNPDDYSDPDIELITRIKNTWDLPETEFGQPFMYERVNWKKRDLSEGN